ncbi:type II toxin-antitoxin system HicA family toxin [Litorimonas sp.]|uniref:type II toxin-antitoxin system HicA family toxin n=1 Tax=Litorimonas sp. TaxID=1892381 RepID=UPI003A8C45F6
MERNSRKLKKLLEADGWYEVGVRGSHVQFKHSTKSGRVTLPHPKKDLKAGTVRSIYKQAGWL